MYRNYKLITFINNVKITKAICICIVCFITKIQNQGKKVKTLIILETIQT